jgi:ubiquinone/menaquinone biosynthesis C-methylase UbiE
MSSFRKFLIGQKNMSLDYENDTRHAYKDDKVAEVYHDAFAKGRGIGNIRFRIVAAREIATVRGFLAKIPHESVVDVPAGTGKLANMFAEMGCKVFACDISQNMLAVAKGVYESIGYKNVEFEVVDATSLSDSIADRYESIVCLRLMHRVPAQVRREILKEFSKVSKYAIVSYGVDSIFQRFRRHIRNIFLGGGVDMLSAERLAVIRQELGASFEIVDEKAVIPVLSAERIFLVRTR